MKRIAIWLYQVYVWLIFYPLGFLLTLIFGWTTVIVATIWTPRIASRYIAANWARVICWMTPVRVTVEGAENADPMKSYVVVCNHQSQYDITLVYGWLKLDLKWVLKKELRKVPGVGIGCEKAGHIYVDRSKPELARKAVRDALDSVGDGVGVLFFPEGTRSLDGKMGPFKKGAFRVATSQKLPILPVTLIGTRNIQKAKSLMIIPGKMRMVIHPPIEVSGADDPETIRELITSTRTAIGSALPPEMR
ncbi:MAG: lysophospholipid acyltransferase family protein [Xanthomonadales bacterium]|nr:lysophospholipid acyltransferase family protein [Xanthomonadales bacterium]